MPRRVLIVHAHPEPSSFNAAMRDAAVATFAARGDEVLLSDLYAMGFDPVGGPADFAARADDARFGYQREQRHAAAHGTFAPDLAAEIAKLRRADGVVFQFPLWWFSLPAILKGWVDRVFAMGVAYDLGRSYETAPLRGKRGMLAFTTGGPPAVYVPGGRNGDLDVMLWHVLHGMLNFVGMDVVPPFVAWSAARVDDAVRASYLARYRDHLAGFWDVAPLRFAPQPGEPDWRARDWARDPG